MNFQFASWNIHWVYIICYRNESQKTCKLMPYTIVLSNFKTWNMPVKHLPLWCKALNKQSILIASQKYISCYRLPYMLSENNVHTKRKSRHIGAQLFFLIYLSSFENFAKRLCRFLFPDRIFFIRYYYYRHIYLYTSYIYFFILDT